MPDSDRVYGKIPTRYNKFYQQLCEGHGSAIDLARNACKPLIRDIQIYGDSPVRFIRQAGADLQEKTSAPVLSSILNLSAERRNIEKLVQRMHGNSRGVEL